VYRGGGGGGGCIDSKYFNIFGILSIGHDQNMNVDTDSLSLVHALAVCRRFFSSWRM
jgi:hypothetical protein